MRRKVVAANWKMNTTYGEATVLAKAIARRVEDFEGIDTIIAPPFLWLLHLKEILSVAPSSLFFAAQNASWKQEGALTGEISPRMLKGSVDYIILGHSERRAQFNETDSLVADKIEACLEEKINPIVCVGETTQSKSGNIDPIIIKQVKSALKPFNRENIKRAMFAYEPRWAIGTGLNASGHHALKVIDAIREEIKQEFGIEASEETRILYGGSVDAQTVTEYTTFESIDGVLVGKASLQAREFIRIASEVQGES